jgi:anti-sigma B factor antagonist
LKLKLIEETDGDGALLEVAGEVTLGDGQGKLGDAVGRLLADGKKRISLDLEGVRYMDSSGLGELTVSYTRIRDAGGQLTLLNPSHKVRELLVMTGLDRLFGGTRPH